MSVAFTLTAGEYAAGVKLSLHLTVGTQSDVQHIAFKLRVGTQSDVQHIAFKLRFGEAAAPTFSIAGVYAGAGIMAPLTALGRGGAFGSATLLPLTATGRGPGRGAGTLLPLFALGAGQPGGAVTLRAMTASGTGQERAVRGAFVILPLASAGTGHQANGGSATLETLAGAGSGGIMPEWFGDWTLPLFGIAGSFLSESSYTGNFRLPLFQKTGTLLNGAAFSGSFKLPMLQNTAALLNGAAFSGNFKLPLFQASGALLPGTEFTASWALPPFSKAGQFGTYQYVGAWTLPMFAASGQAASDIEQTYRGWPINLKNMALSEYQGVNANSLTRFNGEYLAAGSGGLMALTGPDDNGTKIAARIRFGEHDFGIEDLKRLPEAFCTYRSAGDMTLRVIIDGGDTYEYTLLATGNTGMATNRAKIGKAIQSNFYTLEIANIDGVKFDLQNITLHPVVLSRKIGRPPVTRVFTGRMQLPSVTNIGQF